MKALMSEKAKRLLRECGGSHGQGISLALAIAHTMRESEAQFYCTSCNKLITCRVVRSVQLK